MVQTEKNHVKQLLACALLITLLVSTLILVFAVDFVSAEAPGVITVISSDTTWTKADSPYDLTGPILVSNGAKLTIEAGVNVSLNGYDIGVEGTLCALGSSDEKIYFNNASAHIEFRPNSTPWDEQTGSGCMLENIVGITRILSDVPLKIINSVITYDVSVADSSIIHNTEIGHHINAGNSNTFLDIAVERDVTVGESNVIRNSYVGGNVVSGNSISLTDNVIDGEVTVGTSSQILDNTINGHLEADHSAIANNNLMYGLSGDSVQVSNNVVYGSRLLSAGMFGTYTIPPIKVSGSSVVSGNTIYGEDVTPAIQVTSGHSTIIANSISGASIGVYALGDATIEKNLIVNCLSGIQPYESDVVIRNNVLSNNYRGIYIDCTEGSALIELNLIANSTRSGVDIASQATIRNNTFTANVAAITLYEVDSSDVTIVYNNIENCTQHSIYLLRTTGNFDVTNNWWGTTDAQAINLTIYDYKYDFNLGKVNFVPFLTEPNPQAVSTIPEFPSWLLLPLFLVASFAIVAVRRRLVC